MAAPYIGFRYKVTKRGHHGNAGDLPLNALSVVDFPWLPRSDKFRSDRIFFSTPNSKHCHDLVSLVSAFELIMLGWVHSRVITDDAGRRRPVP
jgi:hypothetical protein